MNRSPEIEDLLVSVVNGTASEEMAQRAEQAVRDNPALAEERNFLAALRVATRVPMGETPGEFGLERLRRSLARHRREQRRLRFWRRLTAFAASVLVVVATLHVRPGGEEASLFQVLQGPSRATLQVRFVPAATTVQVEGMLRDLGLEVVSGPSAVGVWRLRLRESDAPEALATAVERLREQASLIEFAELEP